MRNSPWREYRLGLAVLLADQAPETLVNPAQRGGEKLQAFKLLARYDWDKAALREVAGAELSVIIQRALRNPAARRLATVVSGRSYSTRQAPRQLTAECPRKWWNLMATAGMALRAPDESWGYVGIRLNEMLVSTLRGPN